MQNVGRAPNRAYQSAVHAAQDEENKDSHAGDAIQKKKCRYTFYANAPCTGPVPQARRTGVTETVRGGKKTDGRWSKCLMTILLTIIRRKWYIGRGIEIR